MLPCMDGTGQHQYLPLCSMLECMICCLRLLNLLGAENYQYLHLTNTQTRLSKAHSLPTVHIDVQHGGGSCCESLMGPTLKSATLCAIVQDFRIGHQHTPYSLGNSRHGKENRLMIVPSPPQSDCSIWNVLAPQAQMQGDFFGCIHTRVLTLLRELEYAQPWKTCYLNSSF